MAAIEPRPPRCTPALGPPEGGGRVRSSLATRLGPRRVCSGFWSGQKVGWEPVRWGLDLCGAVSPPPCLPSLGVPGGPRLLLGKRTACLGVVCKTKALLECEWKPVGCRLMGGLICRKAVNQTCACGWRTRRMLLDPSGGPVSWQPQLRERGGPGLWSLRDP